MDIDQQLTPQHFQIVDILKIHTAQVSQKAKAEIRSFDYLSITQVQGMVREK